MNSTPLKPIVEKEKQVVKQIVQTKQSAGQRFPLLFALLGTFGVVATYYGFEHLIDQSKLLSENPIILLLVGICTLAFTGTLYKKLG